MAKIGSFTCREHGGTFRKPITRGRRPEKCRTEYPCDKSTTQQPVSSSPSETAKRSLPPRPDHRDMRKPAVAHPAPVKPAEASVSAKPGVALARQAKEHLEALGWVVSAVGRTDDDGYRVELSARRGDELLTMSWLNGAADRQHYSLWAVENTPKQNGRPDRNLGFDPDEMSNAELVSRLRNREVTWYNRLSRGTESAVIPSRVAIETVYEDSRDTTPGERIIKFVDKLGSGFRSFRMDELLSVG